MTRGNQPTYNVLISYNWVTYCKDYYRCVYMGNLPSLASFLQLSCLLNQKQLSRSDALSRVIGSAEGQYALALSEYHADVTH